MWPRLGYAALKTSGLRTNGTPTESELRDVAQRYLEMLCREAAACGVPRERLFAHGAGWKDGELIYDVPVNRFSCPGWSFYQHAADPRQDAGVQRNLAKSDAPYWAATEWLSKASGKPSRGATPCPTRFLTRAAATFASSIGKASAPARPS